jgi:hypothetical protein
LLRPVAVRFYGIGSGRAAELNARVFGKFSRQQREQLVDEIVFGFGHQVQRVQRALAVEGVAHRLNHFRVIVPQGQRTGPRQTVDEPAPFAVLHVNALSALEFQGDAPRIAACVGFHGRLAFQPRGRREPVIGVGQRMLGTVRQ